MEAVSLRGGLPHVSARLSAGEPVCMVYFGGSITDAPGWRVGFDTWLRQNWKAITFDSHNASIGGTGSDLGVFRVCSDVLAFKPDLVFIEFSVNDSNKDAVLAGKCVEGIVRQIRGGTRRCDICLVYTLCDAPSVLEPLRRGELPPIAMVHDKVAEHYGLPSVFLGAEVLRLEQLGKLVLTASGKRREELEHEGVSVFCEDGAHPLPVGHDLYVHTLSEVFPRMLAASAPSTCALPPPLAPDNWERVELIPFSRMPRDIGMEKLAVKALPPIAWGKEHLPELWRIDRQGAGIDFAFTGTGFGIYDVSGPDCGQVSVSIDGQPARLFPRFDRFCTYHRPTYLLIACDLSHATHRVRIELGPALTAKGAIVPEALEQPQRFNGNYWYPAAVLVVG